MLASAQQFSHRRLTAQFIRTATGDQALIDGYLVLLQRIKVTLQAIL